MAKNLVNGNNIIIEENDNEINMNLSSEYQERLNKQFNNIVESGQNYIKYSDGTMICYGIQSYTGTRNNTWGGMYVTNKITGATYPQTFQIINSVNLTLEASGSSAWVLSADSGSTTKLPNYYVVSATNDTSKTYKINYIAIGKWK